jgi:PilZ domain
MLDLSHERNLIVDFWESTATKARLPEPENSYLAPQGAMPVSPGNKRAYHRFYLRGKALLKRQGSFLGIYTKDVSRRGIGFLSPVQLLPKEHVHLHMPGAKELMLEVTRCRRLDESCFDSGGKFVLTVVRD